MRSAPASRSKPADERKSARCAAEPAIFPTTTCVSTSVSALPAASTGFVFGGRTAKRKRARASIRDSTSQSAKEIRGKGNDPKRNQFQHCSRYRAYSARRPCEQHERNRGAQGKRETHGVYRH